jgi:hypothetical protein
MGARRGDVAGRLVSGPRARPGHRVPWGGPAAVSSWEADMHGGVAPPPGPRLHKARFLRLPMMYGMDGRADGALSEAQKGKFSRFQASDDEGARGGAVKAIRLALQDAWQVVQDKVMHRRKSRNGECMCVMGTADRVGRNAERARYCGDDRGTQGRPNDAAGLLIPSSSGAAGRPAGQTSCRIRGTRRAGSSGRGERRRGTCASKARRLSIPCTARERGGASSPLTSVPHASASHGTSPVRACHATTP